MLKYISYSLFHLINATLYTQNFVVSGIESENNLDNLPYANIIAKLTSLEIEMAFAITNEQGRYIRI